jgi:hypothetical protein
VLYEVCGIELNMLREQINALGQHIPDLERQRNETPFANDVFEAASYWLDLGTDILEGNTKVDYPVVSRSEIQLMEKLQAILSGMSVKDKERYAAIFQFGEKILRYAEAIQLPPDGHLGVLRVIREQFQFLQTEFQFAVSDEIPTGLRFSSSAVYVDLRYAKNPYLSCKFGPLSPTKQVFWIDDLLYMYGDQRYKTLPDTLVLNTKYEIESWFSFLASIFKQYGRAVLSNRPGIFERLAKAQAQRDQEYTQEMDRQHGQQ